MKPLLLLLSLFIVPCHGIVCALTNSDNNPPDANRHQKWCSVRNRTIHGGPGENDTYILDFDYGKKDVCPTAKNTLDDPSCYNPDNNSLCCKWDNCNGRKTLDCEEVVPLATCVTRSGPKGNLSRLEDEACSKTAKYCYLMEYKMEGETQRKLGCLEKKLIKKFGKEVCKDNKEKLGPGAHCASFADIGKVIANATEGDICCIHKEENQDRFREGDINVAHVKEKDAAIVASTTEAEEDKKAHTLGMQLAVSLFVIFMW